MRTIRLACCALVTLSLVACSTSEPVRRTVPERPPIATVSGHWRLTVQSPIGRDDVDVEFVQNGRELSGVMRDDRGAIPLHGSVQGDAIEFVIELEIRGHRLHLNHAGAIEGDEMAGTVQFGPMGDGRFSGVRVSTDQRVR